MTDVYCNPEDFGLTVVASLSADYSWEFDIMQAWKHEDGRLFWAQDSGCSCPAPFENYTSLDDLTEIKDNEDLRYLMAVAMQGSVVSYGAYDPTEAVDFVRTVRDHYIDRKTR